MVTKHFNPILGKRIRVTELSEAGTILPTSRQISTNGFITVSLSAETEDGNSILVRRADGSICVNEQSNDSFTRFGVEMEFCGVNPSLLAMVTNAEEYEDYAGDVAGFTVAEGEMTGRFALELWTGLAGQIENENASGYLLLPHVKSGTIGDFEVTGEDAITFSLSNSFTQGGNSWGVGPYNVVIDGGDPDADPPVDGAPAPLPTPLDPMDHLLLLSTNLAPPPSSEDPEVVSS